MRLRKFSARQLRLDAGLTQAALAERLAMFQTTVAKIEGVNRKITVDEAEAWARACGADLGVLLPDTPPLDAEGRDMMDLLGQAWPLLDTSQRQTLKLLIVGWLGAEKK